MKGKLLLIVLFACISLLSCVRGSMPLVNERAVDYTTETKPSQNESSSQHDSSLRNDAISQSDTISKNDEPAVTDVSVNGKPDMMSEQQRRCLEKQVKDYDGNSYHTVYVGNQCWLKENLRATHGRDGKSLTCYAPNNKPSNVQVYGYLYDWRSATVVCPKGWHLPTGDDWEMLEDQIVLLGMSCGDGLKKQVAKAMASESGWQSSSETCAVGNNQHANNASGFSVLPAGLYNYEHYNNFGYKANFWCAKDYDAAYAFSCGIGYDNASIKKFLDTKASGFSVRCVKD